MPRSGQGTLLLNPDQSSTQRLPQRGPTPLRARSCVVSQSKPLCLDGWCCYGYPSLLLVHPRLTPHHRTQLRGAGIDVRNSRQGQAPNPQMYFRGTGDTSSHVRSIRFEKSRFGYSNLKIRAQSVFRHCCRTYEDTLQDARFYPIECPGARFSRLIRSVIFSPVLGGFV